MIRFCSPPQVLAVLRSQPELQDVGFRHLSGWLAVIASQCTTTAYSGTGEKSTAERGEVWRVRQAPPEGVGGEGAASYAGCDPTPRARTARGASRPVLPATQRWSLAPTRRPCMAHAIRYLALHWQDPQACALRPNSRVPAGSRAGSRLTRPDAPPLQPASSAGCSPESFGSARILFSPFARMVCGGRVTMYHDKVRWHWRNVCLTMCHIAELCICGFVS
jgi:hypothetical protein